MKTRTFVQSTALALLIAAGASMPVSGQTAVDAELVPFVGGSFFLADARAPFVVSRGDGAQLIVQDGELRDAPASGSAPVCASRIASAWRGYSRGCPRGSWASPRSPSVVASPT
jgi:hypothetical protein